MSISIDNDGGKKEMVETGSGVAKKLVFVAMPTNGMASEILGVAVKVEIQDSSNNLIMTDASDSVTLAFSDTGNPYPGSATLGGTLTVAAVGGVATFDNIVVDSAGNNFQLSAAGSGVTTATSSRFNIFAATPIFRSIGPTNTSSLADSTTGGSLTIAGTTAIFSNEGLAANIGVGDVVQYDSDDDGSVDTIAFIHGRASSTVFQVRSVSGGTPISTVVADSDWDIFRAYTSLINGEAGTENSGIDASLRNFDTWSNGKDISLSTGSDEVWNLVCYGDSTEEVSSGMLYIWSWTTAVNNYIRIYTPQYINEVGVTQRHSGVWDSSKYWIKFTATSNWTSGMQIQVDFVRVEGIQMEVHNNTYHGVAGLMTNSDGNINPGSKIYLTNNIIKAVSTPTGNYFHGIIVYAVNNGETYIANNVIYDFDTYTCNGIVSYGHSYVYSNTVYNTVRGIRDVNGNVLAKNNLVQATVVNTYEQAFYGSFDVASDYNIGDNGTIPGGNSVSSSAVVFENAPGGDFHLNSSDTVARNVGDNLSEDAYFPVFGDLDGEVRPFAPTNWHVGADN